MCFNRNFSTFERWWDGGGRIKSQPRLDQLSQAFYKKACGKNEIWEQHLKMFVTRKHHKQFFLCAVFLLC